MLYNGHHHHCCFAREMIQKVLGENGGSFSPEMLRDSYEVLVNTPVQDCFSVVKDFIVVHTYISLGDIRLVS